ncbi:hypothetical protein Tco_1276255 [Tanacetum coccineum]
MSSKRTSTSETPAITLDAIRQLTADFTAALEAQTAAMASASNLTRTPAVKTGNYKEFISCQPFCFNGTEGAEAYSAGFKRTISISLEAYVLRKIKVTIATGGPNNEKLLEAFIGGLPRSIEGNVTASKPQTLEEAINISQRLMDQIIKRDSVQETNHDHKRKFEDKRNTIDNNNYPKYRNNNNHSNNRNNDNYQNNHNNHKRNNDYHHQHNRRQETIRTYPAKRYHGYLPLCTRCTLHHT